jgi:hypothetical protein
MIETVPKPLFFLPKMESEIFINREATPVELISPPIRIKKRTHRIAIELILLKPVAIINIGS